MDKADPVITEGQRSSGRVFISYANTDRKEALSICKAMERRGTKCWISCRDVAPGENYQEAIVRSIRDASAMVLVFSGAANNSDEIKKELSLASKHRVPLMALRIEDVEPSDAFAYELSTRQWVDALGNRDRSIDALVASVRTLKEPSSEARSALAQGHRPGGLHGPNNRRVVGVFVLIALLLAVGTGAWWLQRPQPAAAHTMLVRLVGFERLSPDLPPSLPNALNEEMIAAFSTNGVVGVSTAEAPAQGTQPAYALGGTLRRDGEKIKLIAKMTNERSGMTLWSNTYTFNSSDVARLPRWAAVKASWVARCGLFAVSTYPRQLSDQTVGDYLQFCSGGSPTKRLDIARKIVAATPDFSWGWSAVEMAAHASRFTASGAEAEQFRQEGLRAAAEAIRLDPSNSEAYAYKNFLIDPKDLVTRESLLKQGLAARPLACGCEHHFYGNFMLEVGRLKSAVAEYRRAVDVLPLNGSSQIALAYALIIDGTPERSRDHFDAAVDMVNDPTMRDQITVMAAPLIGNYVGVDKALDNPEAQLPPKLRQALKKGFGALQSQDPSNKASAISELSAIPTEEGGRLVVTILGALGANAEALRRIEAIGQTDESRAWLWFPSMSNVIRDPSFPAVAQRLGLIDYWRKTKMKPDVCASKITPSFCSMI